MKKLMIAAAMVTALGLNAAAWFDGGLGRAMGPGGYSRTDAYVTLGGESIWVKPALMIQNSDSLTDSFKTYSLRVGKDTGLYTLAGEVGTTPAAEISSGVDYSNMFFGGDITFSLTPGSGGHGRMAGPNARSSSGGGEGVTGVDVGASLKHTLHKVETTGIADAKTGQTEFSVFAGAKILMARLGASWTGYTYGDENAPAYVEPINGQVLAFIGGEAKSSVNVRLDIPATIPMVAPYASYTTTSFKGSSNKMNAYGFGAYIDLNMVAANVAYQILDYNGNTDGYLSVSAGIKF